MTAATDPASESGAVKYITAASMIDCTGAAARKDPVIVLKGKRIDKIGTKDSIKIPSPRHRESFDVRCHAVAPIAGWSRASSACHHGIPSVPG